MRLAGIGPHQELISRGGGVCVGPTILLALTVVLVVAVRYWDGVSGGTYRPARCSQRSMSAR